MFRIDCMVLTATVAVLALAGPPPAAAGDTASERSEKLRRELVGFFSSGAEDSPGVLGALAESPEAQQAILDRLNALAPQDLDALVEGFAQVPAWQKVPEALTAALPPDSRDALRHYALGAEAEARELEDFRDDLATLYAAVRLLPPATRTGLGIETDRLAGQHETLAGLDLGALGHLRDGMAADEDWRAVQVRMADALPPAVRGHLSALARHGAFDDADLNKLSAFRKELDATIALVDGLPQGLRDRLEPKLAGVRASLSEHTPEQLFVLREELDLDGLRSAIETVALLAGGTPSEARAQELEAWRTATAAFYRDLAAGDPAHPASSAAAAVERASPRKLTLMRLALATPPVDETAASTLAIAIDALPGEVVDQILINLNCVVDLPGPLGNLDLNFICTPIENAINALEAEVGEVKSSVTLLGDVVEYIVDSLAGLPGALVDYLLGALQNFVDILDSFTPDSIQDALGMAGDFWNNLPEFPEIPCPPLGYEIPPFGFVGEEATAAKYERYVWVLDKVLELIPDTESSLVFKVPAQVLYAGAQYVGVCLDSAAQEIAEIETEAFQNGIAADLDGIGSGLTALAGQLGGLGDDLARRMDLLAIEDALAESGSGGRVVPVASFQLPAAVGGLIELVRETVAEVIQATEAAGEDVHCAPSRLEDGDEAYAIGEYKVAYEAYRRAYQEAARAGQAGCQDKAAEGGNHKE